MNDPEAIGTHLPPGTSRPLSAAIAAVLALVLVACSSPADDDPAGARGGSDPTAASVDVPGPPTAVAVQAGGAGAGPVLSFDEVAGADGYALLLDDDLVRVPTTGCDGERCSIGLDGLAGIDLDGVRLVSLSDGQASDATPPIEVAAFATAQHDPDLPDGGAAAVLVLRAAPDDAIEVEVIPVEDEAAGQALVESLQADPEVMSASLDRPGQLHRATRPPASVAAPYPHGWHLDALGIDGLPAAATGAGVVVAVVDTGVDATHPGLAGKVLDGTTIPEPMSPGTRYPRAHGTAVAGMVVGAGPGVPALGSAPGAQVLPIDVFGDGDGFTTRSVVDAIIHAVDAGADVINLSLSLSCDDGGDGCGLEDSALVDAVGYAERNGVLVVASVGNAGDGASYCDTPTNARSWPAALTLVVAVGATDVHGDQWACSTSGADVLVPGTDLEVYRPGADGTLTAMGAGTSFSSPLVAGLAARILSIAPDLPPSALRVLLTQYVDAQGRLSPAALLAALELYLEAELDVPEGPLPVQTHRWTMSIDAPELWDPGSIYPNPTDSASVNFSGRLSVFEDGSVQGVGRTGLPGRHGWGYGWSCPYDGPRGYVTTWNDVEVSGRVVDDTTYELTFTFPERGPRGHAVEWTLRGQPCGDREAEELQKPFDIAALVQDGLRPIGPVPYSRRGAALQTVEETSRWTVSMQLHADSPDR